ncbi:MAG: DUF1328 domain-containing protein [Desulfovibrionaceae bacterium]|nr:DUF1328 domain-containing protein [Desulfovibrionaceae bacterium]
MLIWAIIFLVISLISGALGFSRLAGAFGFMARLIFALAFILFILTILIACAVL